MIGDKNTFAQKHPKAAEFFGKVNQSLEEIKQKNSEAEVEAARKEQESIENAERVRVLERELQRQKDKAFEDAKNAKLRERDIHLTRARTFKQCGNYQEALQSYHQAFTVQIPAKSTALSLLFTTALDPVQMTINNEIAECKNAIKAKHEVLVNEGLTLLESHDPQGAKSKLEQAKAQWSILGSKTVSASLTKLEQAIKWQEKKPEFLANYERMLKIIPENLSGTDYDQFIADLQVCIAFLEKYSGRPTADELSKKQQLERILNQAKETQALQQKTARWVKIRAANNQEFARLASEQLSSANLEARERSLKKLLEMYTQFSGVLDGCESQNKESIGSMLTTTQELLAIKEAEARREADKLANQKKERAINNLLLQAKEALRQGLLIDAINFLKSARQLGNQIGQDGIDDIENKDYARSGYFDSSLKILQDFVGSLPKQPMEIAKSLISRAIDLYIAIARQSGRPIGDNKQCMERHYKRLIDAITDCLKDQWLYFYQKNPLETQEVFNNVVEQIAADMELTTALRRWTPTNWTQASYCLRYDRSKLTAYDVISILEQHKPTKRFEFLLPVFPIEAQYVEPPVATVVGPRNNKS